MLDKQSMNSKDKNSMIRRRSRSLKVSLITMFLFIVVSSCASHETRPPVVPAFNNEALTTTLQRGVSTSSDVKKALGEPNGTGEFLYITDTVPHNIWFYEKMVLDTTGKELDVQQDVLIAFFKEERFDGFLWFSDAQQR